MQNNNPTETGPNRRRTSTYSRHRSIRNRNDYRQRQFRTTERQSYSTHMDRIKVLAASLKEQIEFIAELLHIDNENNTREHC